MNNVINKIYPFLSIGVIEWGNFIANSQNAISIIIFLLQGLIGVLTIVKLWKDIKGHRFTSISKTEKDIKKKHPFLLALLTFLKRKK